jgi:hypothetical protein
LAVHGQSHDFITVLGRNQIRGLQKDAGTFCKGSCSPGLASSQSRVDGGLDISFGSIGVGGERSVGGRIGLRKGLRACNL